MLNTKDSILYEKPTGRGPGAADRVSAAGSKVAGAAANAVDSIYKAAMKTAGYAASASPNTTTVPSNTAAAEQAIYNAAASEGTGTASAPASTPYQAPDYTGQINDIYDKSLAAQRAQIDSGYEASMRELEAAAQNLPGVYQARGNDLEAQYERQRAAFNEQAAANGINTGAGSQAQLAQNAAYQSAYGQIAAAQANAQAALDQQRAAREAEYQTAITQALRDNDYQRAVALAQEMKDQRQADLDRAKILAGYGDFSGYEQIYGADAAKNMRDVWLAQNPQFAYMTGNLTADQYYKLTGKYPADAQPQADYSFTPAETAAGDPGVVLDLPVANDSSGNTATGNLGRAIYNLGTARTEAEARRIIDSIGYENLSAADKEKVQAAYTHAFGRG